MSGGTLVPLEHAVETDIERAATAWIAPYHQVEHLMRTRDWLIHLDPDATVQMRLAAMTHDIERMFPGGPRLEFTDEGWGDPFYLYAHQLRSAEIVAAWMKCGPVQVDPADIAEVRRLVALHEVGGLDGADLVQAADSLSFLEVLAEVARGWVTSGLCSASTAMGKLRLNVDRIRVPHAMAAAAESLFESAAAVVSGEGEPA